MDVWKQGVIEHYEKRPAEMRDISLAQFEASYYIARDGKYKRRKFDRIIRYKNYDMNSLHEYKREMVLLQVPFVSEEIDLLDRNKYLSLYDEKETQILEARKVFESDLGMERILLYCRELCLQRR